MTDHVKGILIPADPRKRITEVPVFPDNYDGNGIYEGVNGLIDAPYGHNPHKNRMDDNATGRSEMYWALNAEDRNERAFRYLRDASDWGLRGGGAKAFADEREAEAYTPYGDVLVVGMGPDGSMCDVPDSLLKRVNVALEATTGVEL